MADCRDCQSRDLAVLRLARIFEAVAKGSDGNQVVYAAAMHQAGARLRELLGDQRRQTELALIDRLERAGYQAELSAGARFDAEGGLR